MASVSLWVGGLARSHSSITHTPYPTLQSHVMAEKLGSHRPPEAHECGGVDAGDEGARGAGGGGGRSVCLWVWVFLLRGMLTRESEGMGRRRPRRHPTRTLHPIIPSSPHVYEHAQHQAPPKAKSATGARTSARATPSSTWVRIYV